MVPRSALLMTALALTLPLTACKWVNKPGAIESVLDGNDPVGQHWLVKGTFTYRETEWGEDGIDSDGYGGACLVVEDSHVCVNDAGCPQPAGGHGYCVDKTANPIARGGAVVGRCWVKQSESFCAKRIKALKQPPLEPGNHDVPGSWEHPLRLPTQGAPWHVRMITCLNPPSDTWKDGVAPCATPTPEKLGARVEVGDPVWVPKGP